MEIWPIRTDEDHAAALKEIKRLWRAEPGTEAADRLEVLATLTDAYERERWPVGMVTPVEALKGHMALNGLTQADFGEVLGSLSKAAAILACESALTLSQIHRISAAWNLPAAYLAEKYPLRVRKVPRGTGRLRPAPRGKARAQA